MVRQQPADVHYLRATLFVLYETFSTIDLMYSCAHQQAPVRAPPLTLLTGNIRAQAWAPQE